MTPGFTVAPQSSVLVEYLVVAGGGAGGSADSGGGGAGGLLTGSNVNLTKAVAYTITVGAGGTGIAGLRGYVNATAAAGVNSSISGSGFTTVTAIGGGGGGAYVFAGGSGGSGGGGSSSNTVSGTVAGGTGTAGPPRQGYNGGIGTRISATYGGGGGGGAGAAGADAFAVTNYCGTGGDGYQWSDGNYYAGGGGGGGEGTSVIAGPGGTGGGGAGLAAGSGTASATSGTVNTGGGGGGLGWTTGTAGSGGSGVVIIRYPDTYPLAASTTGSPTVTNPTGYRVYTFTVSGSITF